MSRVEKCGLQVDENLAVFIEKDILPIAEVTENTFWSGLSALVKEYTPRNTALLNKRLAMQKSIDTWHKENAYDSNNYQTFLKNLGYIEPNQQSSFIETTNVDKEIALMAGPQLVVPINNARYALNAANARWGSLYDALYGTDVIDETGGAEVTSEYNPVRGHKVIARGREFLDLAIPLKEGSHCDARSYKITADGIEITLNSDVITTLSNVNQWVGFTGEKDTPTSLLFKNNELHFEIAFDAQSPIALADKAGISDIVVESALTAIMDCEDSVAAVDAEDKLLVYKNWLGLIKGDLSEHVVKGSTTIVRELAPDRNYIDREGNTASLKGRCLMFVRNVGHLMTNGAILDESGAEIYEGILDAVVTSLIGKIDVLNKGKYANSEQGSVYIVKPKMHGSEEVAFTNELFAAVEDLLGLPRFTLKMGIMDEERRTSINLANCIEQAKNRVVFINTGFLDRTGDEIHTSMLAGPVVSKADMKHSTWISAYEANNVDVGLRSGLSGKAQIGKGMWAIPDMMAEMMIQKVSHPKSGANTAWVPSPTAATLHALHYHEIDVFKQQESIKTRKHADVTDILQIPLQQETLKDTALIERELENNAQGILGYVVRWVEQGVGCSKVPDINDVGLMEDRATLRISSQHIANWLKHGICQRDEVVLIMKKMAIVVDKQNESDPNYKNMSDNYEESVAFQAALELVLEGEHQPNGYTEPVLHRRRLEYKAKYH